MAEVGAFLTGRRTFECRWRLERSAPMGCACFRRHPPGARRLATGRLDSPVRHRRDRKRRRTSEIGCKPKSVAVHGAQTIQQCLNAGLLDEMQIDVAAVLLGGVKPLFDHLANTPAVLGNPTVVTGVGVTHLRYPVHTFLDHVGEPAAARSWSGCPAAAGGEAAAVTGGCNVRGPVIARRPRDVQSSSHCFSHARTVHGAPPLRPFGVAETPGSRSTVAETRYLCAICRSVGVVTPEGVGWSVVT